MSQIFDTENWNADRPYVVDVFGQKKFWFQDACLVWEQQKKKHSLNTFS